MKLRYARNSPFVRKVLVTAIEAGIEDRIEKVATDHMDPNSNLAEHNPLGKVPALVLDDGRVMVEFEPDLLLSRHAARAAQADPGGGRRQA